MVLTKKKMGFLAKTFSIEEVTKSTILSILEAIDTPRSLSLHILLQYGKSVPKDLLDVNPLNFLTARAYQLDAQACATLKKGSFLEYEGDKVSEAEQHFIKTDGEIPKSPDDLLILRDAGFVYDCRRIISSILGEVPPIADLEVSFTSGSNARFKTESSTVADKLSRCIDVSPNAVMYLTELVRNNACLNKVAMTHGFNVIKSDAPFISTFQVVPKQYNKGRGIVKTFFGDMLCQRAFGLYMRKRLKKVGIDLKFAQDVHRDILKNDPDAWATIDLSDASDRISTELCRQLLPLDWFLTLSRIKSDWVQVGQDRIKLNKFMNQGNGFTFELETLLFYAIAMTAMRRSGKKPVCFVYGDDTIVPVASGIDVVEAFESCGLVVNKSKSFLDGSFKESCGFDVFDNVETRPIYIKDLGNEKVFFTIRLANIVHEVAQYLFGDISYDVLLSSAHALLLNLFKTKYQFRIPRQAGDVAFIATDPVPLQDKARGVSYYKFFKRTYDRRYFKLPVEEEASQLAFILSGHSSKGDLIRFSRYDITTGRLFGF